MMKVLVVSGFLGAGKTTFIRTLIRKTGKSFCILENEYAGSTADRTILQDEEGIQVQVLTEGCICCTMRNSFSNKLMNILAIYQPDYLLVEATGIGYLSRILANIQIIEHENLQLLEPVAIVEAAHVEDEESLREPLCLDQIVNAQTVVISKCELWDDAERMRSQEILRNINPEARIVTQPYQELPASWWLSLLERYRNGRHVEERRDVEEKWESLSLSGAQLRGLAGILNVLQDSLRGRYGRIIRAKGFQQVDGRWVYCDLSGGRYSVTFTDAPSPAISNIVFIGTELDRGGIRSCFRQKIRTRKVDPSRQAPKMLLRI